MIVLLFSFLIIAALVLLLGDWFSDMTMRQRLRLLKPALKWLAAGAISASILFFMYLLF